MRHIELCSHFEDVHRTEHFELPEEAIRELIAYVVSQRNYLFPEKIQIALYADRLEITAPGMVYDDLAIEKIKKGISRPSNPAITNAFIYLGLIKTWGSSIPRLFALAKEYNLPKPSLESLGPSLRINIFRQNAFTNNAQA
ncbi:MAG: hypothetical protein GX938_07250 [Spirochaetales bacterium]|jgi:ATP-dependent DNA helicase RecG|nr:hypothetical protein [Spirochaetales bacterium]